MSDGKKDEMRRQILGLVEKYYAEAFPKKPFVGGISQIPVSGKVFDGDELVHLVDSSLDFWLTAGRYAQAFEEEFAKVMGVKHAMLCNSGSSANLLAVSALKSERLGDRALADGDEVITLAAGFPTTVNPILQNRLVPVFIDCELGTYDANPENIRAAISPKTRAIVMAHTLGNPFNLDAVMQIAKENDLFVVEDSCDAVGATYDGKPVGSFGDLASASFYPAHHVTMGEGGCVLAKTAPMRKIVESLRDWGRDCWCLTGEDNTCGRRFDWQLGSLPYGFDHKYTYSHIGYNLKLTEMQAAVGVAQLKKLPRFIAARRRNFDRLLSGLKHLEEFFVMPATTPRSEPSWFGFLLTVKPTAPFSRYDVVQHLESHRIATRQLFGGNLLAQPGYQGIEHRVSGTLKNTELVSLNAFWIGVFPGLSDEMIDYMIETIDGFVKSKK
ncbi:MAG: lipopolysaccharide biosynthesis protein RfbH [Actinomycetota bacterium]